MLNQDVDVTKKPQNGDPMVVKQVGIDSYHLISSFKASLLTLSSILRYHLSNGANVTDETIFQVLFSDDFSSCNIQRVAARLTIDKPDVRITQEQHLSRQIRCTVL